MTDSTLTEIAVILDRSGSMAAIRADMEGGFGHFAAAQRKLPGRCVFSLYQFDNTFEVVYEEVPASDVPPLVIQPRGGTALLDAMGYAMTRIGGRLAGKPEHLRPGAVIVQTITDGQENSSREYGYPAIANFIRRQQSQYNWQFMYLGSDVSTVSEASKLGIYTVSQMAPTRQGINDMYLQCSSAIGSYRSAVFNGTTGASLSFTDDKTTGIDNAIPMVIRTDPQST